MTKKAFTFIQVIIAMFVISIALGPIMMINRQNNRNLEENNNYMEALMIATTVLSQIKQEQFIKRINSLGQIKLAKDNPYNIYIPQDFFKEEDFEVIAGVRPEDNNFTYLFCIVRYKNTAGNITSIRLDSGAFHNVY
ncbi:MAG: hypothetical protein M0R46_09705 [Candidatus Muirbacterium halophilum]|nr:hypothetical protein [Candidatus Muirbacterium halophilum]